MVTLDIRITKVAYSRFHLKCLFMHFTYALTGGRQRSIFFLFKYIFCVYLIFKQNALVPNYFYILIYITKHTYNNVALSYAHWCT